MLLSPGRAHQAELLPSLPADAEVSFENSEEAWKASSGKLLLPVPSSPHPVGKRGDRNRLNVVTHYHNSKSGQRIKILQSH